MCIRDSIPPVVSSAAPQALPGRRRGALDGRARVPPPVRGAPRVPKTAGRESRRQPGGTGLGR
eukprot:8088987-Alexandrium_andersonii.AAC.1